MKILGITRKIFFLIIILLIGIMPVKVSAEKSVSSVKVGYFAFSGYHDIDKNGVMSGYGYDIIQKIASHSSLEFEFVNYEMSWENSQLALEKGEIDILTSAQKNAERLEKFEFSDLSIGTSSTILTVKSGNTKYILDEYNNWDGIRVGVIKGNSRNEGFKEFAKNHNFTYSLVEYENTEELTKALQNEKVIDAAVTSNLRRISNEWILSQFDASPFYVIVKKGNTELMTSINHALQAIYDDNPNFDQELSLKYYASESGQYTGFTTKENNVIVASKKQPIKMGIILSGAPICYINENGQYDGISIKVLNYVSEKTGLIFEYNVIDQSKTSPIVALKEGQLDLVSRIFKTEAFLSDQELVFSNTLTNDSIAMVGKIENDNEKNRIAIPRGFQTGHDYINDYFSEYELVEYDTIEECLNDVSKEEVDTAVYLRNRISYLLQNPHYEKLTIVETYSYDLPSSVVGLNNENDKLLISIINKGLMMITESEKNTIMLDYSFFTSYQLSFSDFIYKYRLPLSVVIIALLLIAASVTWIFVQRHKNEVNLEKAYQQTKDALSLAENASSAKSQFLSRVSHEMRTPLNAIIGFLELSKDATPEETKVYLENSNIAAKQLLLVINDVLDMSAIEAGKMSIASSPFDFKSLIHSITNLYMPQCANNNIKYETKILTPVDEWLIGDQLRVNQILFNILNNAIKFTKEGSIELSISQTQSTDNEVFIHFQISDTGCGISEDMLKRLFKPFEQESSVTASKYGGSGLGLSIVKNLVSMMQGAINVESQLGKGTTFSIDLPFAKSDAEFDYVLSDEDKELRVLVIDDEQTEIDYVNVILNRMKVRHTCVIDAKKAIDELNTSFKNHDEYQICLIDWKMPNMNGIETTKMIRKMFGKNVLVIVISAYEHSQANETAKKAGANLFIPKPLFQSSLFNLFMTLTGGKIGRVDKKEIVEKIDFTGKRVLLAEDNAMNKMVCQAIINKMGISCELAEDGQVAIDKFMQAPKGYYDAILMDIQMPNVDGYEATKVIRNSNHPEAKDIQIIALTANAFNEDIAKALSVGMNAHVSKPIAADELSKALNKAFASKKR